VDDRARSDLDTATLALEVRLPRHGMASAEVRVLNWGGASGAPDFAFGDVALGSRLSIALGEDADAPAFEGEVTGLEERYGDGAPQLVLLAEDALHRLARRRESRAFEDVSLDAVVSRIASDAGLAADVRVSPERGTWLQQNESDLAFLLRQLAPHDVALRLEGGRLRARDEEEDPAPARLSPAENADRVRIVADLNHQPREVAVSGHDLHAGVGAAGRGDRAAPAPAGETAAEALQRLGWEGRSTLPHPFARSQPEAEATAARRFRAEARRFLAGDVVARDAAQLRGGREVTLEGVSARFAGRYRVEECRHLFDAAQGLRTRLRVQRPDWSA
jgi:phage protein D